MKQEDLKAARRLQRDVERHQRTERKRNKCAVLHLRIEGDIMDRIKAEALARDLSVSDLVRCHLAERFSETRGNEGVPGFLLQTPVFSDATVMRDSSCAACGTVLPRGTNARLAHGTFPAPRLVCNHCYEGLQGQLEDQPKPSQEKNDDQGRTKSGGKPIRGPRPGRRTHA